jgi:hypothetical protein
MRHLIPGVLFLTLILSRDEALALTNFAGQKTER